MIQPGTHAPTAGAAVDAGPETAASPADTASSTMLRSFARGQSGSSARLLVNPKTFCDSTSLLNRQSRLVGAEYVWQSVKTAGSLVLIDLAVICFAIAATRGLFFAMGSPSGFDVSAHLLPISLALVSLCGVLGLYPGIRLSPVEELRRVVTAVTCVCLIWAGSLAIIKESGLTVQPWFLLAAFVACAIMMPVGRTLARGVLGRCRWWGFPTLVCGNDAAAVHLLEWIKMNPQLGLRPVGLIASRESLEFDESEPWYLGDWAQAPRLAKDSGVYWALLVPSEEVPKKLASEVSDFLGGIPHIQILTELTGLPDHWGDHQPVEGLAGVHLQQNLLLPGKRLMKRVIDLVLSIAGVVVLLPLLLAVALAVKLTSRGPLLFGHTRLGLDGREFKAWKFRTMVSDADKALTKYLAAHPEAREEWERDQKLKWDPRVTSVGRVFRKLSLDELPQLWNVIRGDMSLVGPRPIVTKEIEKYGDTYQLYLSVKPGITGLWQVSGRNNTTYEERVQLDEYYVRNWSPWLDVYLMMHTVHTVLFAKGAY